MPKHPALARIARAYLSWYRSENNVWADSNGEFWLLSVLIPHCRKVIDVGANFGDWTRRALDFNPALSVDCFEPASDNFAKLTAQRFGDAVTLNQTAVSDHDGELVLNIFGDNSPFNSAICDESNSYGAPVRKEVIPCLTLDSYFTDHGIARADYVKIDVEGAELSVLNGMSRLFGESRVDAVQIEYGLSNIYSRTFLRDYFMLFERSGFEMFKIGPKRLIRYERYVDMLDNFQHQNWLAVRKAAPLYGKAMAVAVEALPI